MQRRELRLAGIGVGIALGVAAGTVLCAWAPWPCRQAWGSGPSLGSVVRERHSPLLDPASAPGAAAGFAAAAPIGSVLIMILVQAWRTHSRDGIKTEIEYWNQHMVRPEHLESATILIEREELADCTLGALRPPCQVLWIERAGESFPAEADTHLLAGDVVHVAGTRDSVHATAVLLGKQLPPAWTTATARSPFAKFFVSNPEAIGVRIDHLHLRTRFSATVTRVRRAGVSLLARPGLRFRWGDRVQVSVAHPHTSKTSAHCSGMTPTASSSFAFPRAALTIFIGGLLGAMPIQLGEFTSLRVGPAVGVLAVSMFLAAVHRTGPMIWSQSGPTLRNLSHIGLPLFLAQVGNASYHGLISAWSDFGFLLLLLAIVPVVMLAVLSALAGRAFKLGPLTLLSLAPSTALNTPALTAIQDRYRERIPSHVYAAVYPVVIITVLLVALVVSIVSTSAG